MMDFGSVHLQEILGYLRGRAVDWEVFAAATTAETLAGRGVEKIILSGGPDHVWAQGSRTIDRKIFGLGVPVLGICYGHQLIAMKFGGEVEDGEMEDGYKLVRIMGECPLFRGLEGKIRVFMHHSDYVTRLPEGFLVVGDTPGNEYAVYWEPYRKIFGVQFHPEVGGDGYLVLDNFLKLV